MAKISEELKQAKLCELANLIFQYNNGETQNINVAEYDNWVAISEALKVADIQEKIYSDFLANPSHYKIVEGEIVFNKNWQAEEEAKEQQRIALLHMTKLDFFKFVLEPNGITYAQLQAVLSQNDSLKATWELCNHVYRGDETLNQFIFAQIPSLTPEALTEIFEAHKAS